SHRDAVRGGHALWRPGPSARHHHLQAGRIPERFPALPGRARRSGRAEASRMKVAILGTGIAGLCLGHAPRRHAARAGRPLELSIFEAQARAGGRLRTTEDEGFRIEWAADAFQTGSGPALALL